MATQTKNSSATLPPKRGKIKAQIYNTLVKKVKSTVNSISGGTSDAVAGDSNSSGETSPPPSGYNSDGNPNA